MVKKIFNVFFILLCSISLFSQNLVKNSSFEEYIRLPKYRNEPVDTFFAKDWTHVYEGTTASVDYIFHNKEALLPDGTYCKEKLIFTYPSDIPNPISGDAYVRLGFWGISNKLEFITGTLLNSLEKDKRYIFSVKLRQHTNSILYSNKLEVSFEKDSSKFISKDRPIKNNLFLYDKNSEYGKIFSNSKKQADIVLDNIPYCKDTSLWICIEQEFIAKGGEKYLTLGLFYQDEGVSKKIEKLKKEAERSAMSINEHIKTILKYKIPFINVNKEYVVNNKMGLNNIICGYYIDDVSITEIKDN